MTNNERLKARIFLRTGIIPKVGKDTFLEGVIKYQSLRPTVITGETRIICEADARYKRSRRHEK